jgi:PPP family 3-phenylpropionic acid transporter
MLMQHDARSSAPRYFAYRTALVFSAPMIVNGIALPYFPVWLQSNGMNAAEIAAILAVPMVLRVIVAPVVSMISDRLGERANVLIWSSILSFLTAIALFWSSTFWPVAIIFGLQGAVYSPYIPVTESILLTGVRRWGFDYGLMRLWGSLAFIGSSIVAGALIGQYGGGMVLPAMAIGFVLTIMAALIAPRTGRSQAAHAAIPPQRNILTRPYFLLLLIGASLSQSSHAMLFASSAIDWGKAGFTGTEIGILWSAGVFAEVIVFLFARRLLRNFSNWALVFLGIGAAILRWLAYPLADGFAAFFALQCLHAFTFGTAHLAIQNAIVENVGASQEASAQGLYFFFNGSFLALATYLSGSIYVAYGHWGFWSMAAISTLGMAFVLAGFLLQPQRPGSGGMTRESR